MTSTSKPVDAHNGTTGTPAERDAAGGVYDADVAPKEAILHDPAQIFENHPGTRPHMTSPVLIIVMGVSGCGKSTVGQRLADKFRIQFVDGDSLHPTSNIQKMSAGTPLTDEDRFPWLGIIRKEAAKQTTREALHEFYHGNNLKDPEQPRAGIVIACSALKRSYRDILRGTTHEAVELDQSHAELDTHFLFLNGTREVLMKRMESRKGHFFSPKMLDSQLQTLEPPSNKEENTQGIVEVNIDQPIDSLVDEAAKRLSELTGLKVLED
ncbi:carbohydrate kinase [Cystobasidium minutum MCA 4210]|uniref:carbohydrate kinase n=1 Tax=Cystobasidium minutum MCA 4210 TaxID=1397322 RepID=UPI0034CD793A|eukprot:jgi/Rhomi1/163072/estExt_Genewise1Plus.C_7_t10085